MKVYNSISHFVHDKALFLFELHFVFVCDANTGDFLHDVDEVMSDNVVQDELPLIPKIYCCEILRFVHLVQEIAGASSARGLEPIVLECDEPGEGEQVGDDDIRAHHLEHTLLALEVVHKH